MPARPRRKNKPSAEASRSRPGVSTSDRLQKVLAAAGIGSRRQCEELISAGRVEIDRQMVTQLGTRVDPLQQEIRVDGTLLRQPRQVYYAVNKPTGVVSTTRDPAGRPRVTDLVPESGQQRLFPIGRLDMTSEGLILLTNDGELANLLTHPRYEVEKTYRVEVAGQPTREVMGQLRRGIRLAEGIARVEGLRVKSRRKESTVMEMVLREGRNREIRRVLARVGHKVLRLKRIAVGPVRLGKLAPGEYRQLKREEIQSLRLAAKESSGQQSRRTSVRGQRTAGQPKPSPGPKKKRPQGRR